MEVTVPVTLTAYDLYGNVATFENRSILLLATGVVTGDGQLFFSAGVATSVIARYVGPHFSFFCFSSAVKFIPFSTLAYDVLMISSKTACPCILVL